MASKDTERKSNQSVAKLMQLLRCMSGSRVPMRLQDISVLIGVPAATTLRYLGALIEEGYVYQDLISGRYALTWKVADIGDNAHSHMSLRSLSADIINELLNELDLGICLVIEEDNECVYLDCVYDPDFALMRIGKRTPMYAASSGKILLSALSAAELDRYLEAKRLIPLTKKTISTAEKLKKELEKVRKRGYAVDDEECEEGLRCVAVPVNSYSKQPIAALSVFGAVDRVTVKAVESELLPALRRAAEELSVRAGWAGPA